MTKATWHARPPAADDAAAVLALLRESFDDTNLVTSDAFFRWKHADNPAGPSHMLLALRDDDGAPLGLRAFMRWEWRCGAGTLKTLRAVDTVTHPRARGQGIFTHLTMQLRDEARDHDVAFIFNTPNRNSLPGYMKMGWHVVTRVPVWLRIVRPLHFGAHLLRRGHDELLPAPPSVASIQSVLAFVEDAGLHDCASSLEDRLSTAPTLRQLHWRYADIPGISYFGAHARVGTGAAAVIARTRRRAGARELALASMFASSGLDGLRALRRAVRDVVALVAPDHVVSVARMRSRAAQVLATMGFVVTPRVGPILTVYPLRPFARDPTTWSSWSPSLGDLEVL